MTTIDNAAEQMFMAYNAQGPNPWQTFDGRPVPRWPELNDQVRLKWIAAARQAQALFGNDGVVGVGHGVLADTQQR